jgi:spore maturation protein SpmA
MVGVCTFAVMALSRIWTFFFGISFLAACYQWLWLGQPAVFGQMGPAMLTAAKTALEISIGLVGVMSLWLGVMRLGEAAGAIAGLARILAPVLKHAFPDVPEGHPALGAMIMNFSANMLGLDSAATPLGLEAMRQLQTLNTDPERASNAQVMFTLINTAGLTLIPVSVMVFRAQYGAANPADIFIPSLLGTAISALSGFLIVAVIQKVKLSDPWLFIPLIGLLVAIGVVLFVTAGLNQARLANLSLIGGNFLMVSVITGFVVGAAFKRVAVFDTFIDGAKQGFQVGVNIIPYLVAMLVAIAALRSSGVLGLVLDGIAFAFEAANLPTEFIPVLPTALMKPLSGAGARGLMLDTMKTYGADSFIGKLVCTVQGSTETTFYVLALYFGSVGVKNTRYTLGIGLLVDFIGVCAAILLGYLFFGGEN